MDAERPRHRRPMNVRDTLRSNCDAQHAAPLRPSLANPCALKNASKFCPGVVADSAVLTAAGLCAAQHCKYLKEAPRRESRAAGFHVKVRCGSRADLRLPARC